MSTQKSIENLVSRLNGIFKVKGCEIAINKTTKKVCYIGKGFGVDFSYDKAALVYLGSKCGITNLSGFLTKPNLETYLKAYIKGAEDIKHKSHFK